MTASLQNKIVVTGALGYLSSHVINNLPNNNIIALVKTKKDANARYIENCKRYNLKDNSKKITFVECDISDPTWKLSNKEIDIINSSSTLINCAGELSVTGSFESLKKTNTESINFLKNINIPVVHISTLAVFVSSSWNKNYLKTTTLERQACTTIQVPENLTYFTGYSKSKAEAELLLNSYDKISIIRPSQIIGDIPPYKDDLYYLFKKVMKRLNCRPTTGNYKGEINLVHINKVVNDIISLVTTPQKIAHSFGKNIYLKELTQSYQEVEDSYFWELTESLSPLEKRLIKNTFLRPLKEREHPNINILLSTNIDFKT